MDEELFGSFDAQGDQFLLGGYPFILEYRAPELGNGEMVALCELLNGPRVGELGVNGFPKLIQLGASGYFTRALGGLKNPVEMDTEQFGQQPTGARVSMV